MQWPRAMHTIASRASRAPPAHVSRPAASGAAGGCLAGLLLLARTLPNWPGWRTRGGEGVSQRWRCVLCRVAVSSIDCDGVCHECRACGCRTAREPEHAQVAVTQRHPPPSRPHGSPPAAVRHPNCPAWVATPVCTDGMAERWYRTIELIVCIRERHVPSSTAQPFHCGRRRWIRMPPPIDACARRRGLLPRNNCRARRGPTHVPAPAQPSHASVVRHPVQ